MTYRNLAELHRRRAEDLGPRMALRYKRDGLYHDLSWDDYRGRSLACAAALADVGIQAGDRVGLLSENRLEWLLVDMAILAAGAVNVPPHAPLTASQIHYQLADAGVRWLFVSTREQMEKVRQIRDKLPALEGVVVFDRDALGTDNSWWPAFLQRGRGALPFRAAELKRRELSLGSDDLATIMYTSGTTGNPKGVMLTHGNLLSNAVACDDASPREPDAVVLSWLPLSHIYGRTVDHYVSLVTGVTLALAESSETVVLNLMETQPTHISCVPRFYEKLLPMVAGPDPAITGKRLKGIFGPRMEWLGSGGAPLPCPVSEAYHAAGFNILQGYGLTETAPVLTFNRKDNFKLDTVGLAIPGVELRIGLDGEILTRGPQVMKGYWNDPEATQRAIPDGWFHTGDLGTLDADGFLKITGRKKEIMVLSSGKKVVPNFIEGLLLGEPCIDQAVIYGEGRSFLTALIVPQWAVVRKSLPAEVAKENDEALAKHPAVRKLLEDKIQTALKEVASWEKVKCFLILARPFSVAAEELTVSLKLRRGVIFGRYGAQIEELYRSAPTSAAED
ncbi:MAG TPA: AMP-dependent synthetase/ligase [Gemmataceae bacterium]|nr:AMP-dependent synthetase/ligase [Gemmataceae bacterium]